MYKVELSSADVADIQALTASLASHYDSVEDVDFLQNVNVFAQELPRSLRKSLNDFKLREPSGTCIISGYPIDDTRIGLTPPHWQASATTSSTRPEEFTSVLFGSLLGDVFAWSTQQDGRIVHDLLPVKGHENEQMGSGSEVLLWWHTEEAFHPYRCDYLGLMCLRNPDGVATTIASLDGLSIDQDHLRTLFEPHYYIRPDESHFKKNQSVERQLATASDHLLELAYERISVMQSEPQKVPVLFGDPQHPYICIDPFFMDQPEGIEAQEALKALTHWIDTHMTEVVLQPGDMCFIDNFRAVHGRKPFKARYDGRDRWLKRVNVTRDLRKSRSMRISPASRTVF